MRVRSVTGSAKGGVVLAENAQVAFGAAGHILGRDSRLKLRWRARDRERDALRTSVAYSTNRGRRWREVYSGPDRSNVTLPRTLFKASKRARVRVVVSDGFSEGVAVSPVFRMQARKPTVAVLSPTRKRRTVGADEPVALAGRAADDAGGLLGRKRPAWYDGKRRIARGGLAMARGFKPGRHRIRLVARGAGGRKGAGAFTLRVRAVKPRFVVFAPPRRISRRARVVRLRVATSVKSTLTIRGGARRLKAKLGIRTRVLRLRVRPGARALRLVLRLRGGGRSATERMRLAR